MTAIKNAVKGQTNHDDLLPEQSNQTLLRMKKHADKTRSFFAKILKLKAPSVTGRLAGPANPSK